MSSYHYTPSSVGGRSGGSGSLKSCLRKGNYKYSSSQRSCGATASITTYSSAPQKQQLQYQYNNQQQQARQDEQSSHRSTSSAPCRSTLIGGGSLQQHSSSHQSIISYASSAPTTTRGGHNSSNSNSSYHSVSQHSNSNSVQDDERQFMLTSKQLVEHHQSHTSLNSNSSPHHHSTTQTALSILNIHLPTPYQKIQYYKLLQNNINYLPMFPESNENNSLIIIRYVNRVFGDVLGREVNGGGGVISCGSVGGSLSGVNNNSVANSQIGYPPPSQQQSQQSYLQQQYNLSTNTQPQTEIIAQSMLSPRSAHPQQQQSSASANHRTVVNSSPKQFSRSGYSLDGDNCNPPQPMFAPPSSSSVRSSNGVSQGVSRMSQNVPPPIPMNYHHQSSTRERTSSIQAQLLSPPSSGLTQQRQSLPPPNTGCLQPMYHPPQYHNVTFAQSTEDGASTTHSVTSASQSYQMGVAAAGSPLPQPLSFASSSVANKSVTGSYVDSGGLEAVGSTTSEGKIDQVIHKIEAILNSPGGGGGNGGGGNSVSTGHDRSTIDRSLIGTFTSSSSSIDDDESLRRKVEQFDIDTSSEANSRRIGQHSIDTSGNSRTSQFSRSHSDSSSTTSHQQQHGIGMKNEYQTFQTNDMLPPLKTRESILYYPPITSEDTCGRGTSLSCCASSKEVGDIGSNKQLIKRPSNYLQLYIKCERSEPYINQDLDLVTWYRSGGGGSKANEGGKNTANRTLVVKNTTNLEELIIGIMTSFGLSSPEPDNEDVDKEVNVSQGELKRRYEQERTAVDESLSSASSSKTLGCYNDVCFISDIKTTTASSTVGIGEGTTKKTTYLTPLPVPGLYYKYIDRPDNGHNPIAVNSKSSNEKKNEHRDKKKGGSSVLSTDPLGFKRTLLGQILDKPIYSSSGREGIRNRLALVYCTPKRQSYVSSRSTQYGTMPETIYHFQILLEGIVNEYDLPSSFASQSSIRCVGATGGVLGGSVMDTQYEINDLNRILWKKNGQPQQVIGLPSSSNNHGQVEDELEQILCILGVPLFDTNGNQTPKEFVVDRALYNIYSGKLSMEVAQQTQHTLAKLEGTTDWLARRVEDFAQTLTKGAAACEDRVYEQTFGTEYDEDFENAVSRLEAKTQWVFS